ALVWNGGIAWTIGARTGGKRGLPQDGQSLLPFAQTPATKSTRPILFETGPPGGTFEPGTGTAAAASGHSRPVKIGTYVKNTDLDHTAQIARAIVAPRYRGIPTRRYLLTK